MTVSEAAAESPAGPSVSVREAFGILWRAFLLDGRAYRRVISAASPARTGFKILTVLFLTVGLATALGMVLQVLTLPEVDQIQAGLDDVLTSTQLYQGWVAQGSSAATVFNVLYQAFWFMVNQRLDYPTRTGILLAPLSLWLAGLFRWVTFAIFGEYFGRRFGGTAPRRAFWGALAVAFAPQLFYILTVIPGLAVPSGLVFGWTILTSYQAMRVTFPTLTWRRTLVAQVLMIGIHYTFIALSLVLGIMLGVFLYGVLF